MKKYKLRNREKEYCNIEHIAQQLKMNGYSISLEKCLSDIIDNKENEVFLNYDGTLTPAPLYLDTDKCYQNIPADFYLVRGYDYQQYIHGIERPAKPYPDENNTKPIVYITHLYSVTNKKDFRIAHNRAMEKIPDISIFYTSKTNTIEYLQDKGISIDFYENIEILPVYNSIDNQVDKTPKDVAKDNNKQQNIYYKDIPIKYSDIEKEIRQKESKYNKFLLPLLEEYSEKHNNTITYKQAKECFSNQNKLPKDIASDSMSGMTAPNKAKQNILGVIRTLAEKEKEKLKKEQLKE